MRIWVLATLALLKISDAYALTETERQLIADRVNSGAIAGGVFRIEIKQEDAMKVGTLYVEEAAGGKFFINRDLDPKWQACVKGAAASWILAYTRAPVAGPPPADIDATDLSKLSDCNRAWHRSLHQVASALPFEALSIGIKAEDSRVADYIDLIASTVQTGLVRLHKGGKLIDVDVKDAPAAMKVLASEFVGLTKEHSALAKSLIDEVRKAADGKQVALQRDRISTAVTSVQLLSRVVLRNDPGAQFKIATGARSIGVIANAVADLKRNYLQDGAKVLLSGNIANAALALVSMFGPGAKDPVVTMLESGFGSVRQDIKQLREEMHDRFDRVDKALEAISATLETRFSRLDKKIDALQRSVDALSVEQRAHYKIEIEAFAALLSQTYRRTLSYCLNSQAKEYLDYGAYANCLVVVAQYGADDARNYVVNGAVLFNPSGQPEEAARLVGRIEAAFLRGLLAQSLSGSAALLGPSASTIMRKVPSPTAWANAVDTYFSLRDLAPSIKNPEPIKVVPLTEEALSRMKSAGEETLVGVYGLRREGAEVALEIYLRDALALIRPAVQTILDRLSARNLDIMREDPIATTQPSETATDMNGYLIRGQQLVFKKGLDENKKVIEIWTRRHYVITGVRKTQAGIHDVVTRGLPEALRVTPLESYNEARKDTLKADIAAAVAKANREYLNKEKMSAWPAKALEALKEAVTAGPEPEDLKTACRKLGETKLYLDTLVTLYRDKVDLSEDAWARELAALPTASDGENPCSDFMRFAFSDGSGLAPQEGRAADILEATIRERIYRQVGRFRHEYGNSKVNTVVPEIQLRLDRIERCITAQQPTCP